MSRILDLIPQRCVSMIRLLIFLLLIINCCNAAEQKPVRLGFSLLPGVLDENNSSPYNQLLDVVSKRADIDFDGNFFPSIRSNHFLENGQIDCIYPIAKGGYKRQIKTLFSESFNTVTTHLFTLQQQKINSLQDASGKTVVYLRGYLFANLVLDTQNSISFVPVENTDAALQLLMNGRADAYLEYMPDLKFGLSERRFTELSANLSNPLQTLEDVIECSDTIKNRDVITVFNSVLADLKSSGQLKQILGEYYNMQ